MHSIAQGIEDFHEILSKFWIIVIGVAAVEIGHEPAVFFLGCPGIAPEPEREPFS